MARKKVNGCVFHTYEEVLDLLKKQKRQLVQFFAKIKETLTNYIICEHPFRKNEKRILVYTGNAAIFEQQKGRIIRIFGETRGGETSFVYSICVQFLPQDLDLIKTLEYVLSVEREFTLKKLINLIHERKNQS